MNNKNKPLGLWMATSLVLGNMIGSGIFLLPATLAPYGGISIVGWLVTTLGAITFALVFSQLAQKYPNTGGLYVYCREEFGEAVGFLLAWSYWLSVCIGTSAIAIAFTSYLSYFIPILNHNTVLAAASTLGVVWLLTLINAYSVFSGGIMQLVTTILKILPIILISCFGIFQFNFDNFIPFNPSGKSDFSAVITTAGITLWAFLGLECASIPAGNIENPKRTIPLATILGTLIAAVIYIASTISVMSLVPPSLLQNSSAPFSDAAHVLWGHAGGILVGIGAIIACFGAVNGWILVQGQMSFAIAQDKLLPKIFTKTSKHGAPYMALIISGIISSLNVLINYNDSLITIFSFMIMLSTITTVIAFLFCAIAKILIIGREKHEQNKTNLTYIIISLVAFTYGLFAITSTECTVVFWSFITLLLGLPVYGWVKYHHYQTEEK